jgi:hypothetical protein
MIYDGPCSLPGASFAHLPIYGPRSGFGRAARPAVLPSAMPPRRPGRPAGVGRPRFPINTNRGGLSYMHSGMYALQESMRQMRGTAPAQIPGAKIRYAIGVGGMFAAWHHHHVERGALGRGV